VIYSKIAKHVETVSLLWPVPSEWAARIATFKDPCFHLRPIQVTSKVCRCLARIYMTYQGHIVILVSYFNLGVVNMVLVNLQLRIVTEVHVTMAKYRHVADTPAKAFHIHADFCIATSHQIEILFACVKYLTFATLCETGFTCWKILEYRAMSFEGKISKVDKPR
jgi:hypothetical protein